ncbi:MAG: conjugal transfer protein TrbI, partial [Paracoccaceae bacterium]|nr:conjugal transfer protein TrbI [Paracoccaceae bacterium]
NVGGKKADPNGQAAKAAFLQRNQATDTYLHASRTPPRSRTEIKAGTVIPALMVGGINSDLPGQIVGQVSRNVYDTATGRCLLIPAGAKVIGTYDSAVTHGQSRVLVAWNRIIFPDGSSISLGAMPGTDAAGYAGFHDRVNRHFWRVFGDALFMSVLGAGAQLSQGQTSGTTLSNSQIAAAALGLQLNQVGSQLIQNNMNVQPTLVIRPGYQFNVMITKDVILPPWRG